LLLHGGAASPNIRAQIIFGIFGTLYWYAIGWLIKIIIVKINAKKLSNLIRAENVLPS
jgi:hypothetical protein